MTHAEAMKLIRRLAAGLSADDGGVARLLERVSVHSESEALRDALAMDGARSTLEATASLRDRVLA